jgi:ferrochelatase
LRSRLIAVGRRLPVYIGMRNWHPLLPDTLQQMHAEGKRRAVGFIAAAHHSYSSCQQYRENVAAAQEALRANGGQVEVTFVESWFDHPLFIAANASHVRDALHQLPADVRSEARLIFTAHSIPKSMADSSQYQHQLRVSCDAIAAQVGMKWALVYQSRSGRPQDPWLEPDVCEYLRREHADGLPAAVLCPVGFVCDHIEVLYDLDREAADACASIGLPMVRAQAVNDDPLFIDMMADVVLKTVRRYETGRPLPLVRPA